MRRLGKGNNEIDPSETYSKNSLNITMGRIVILAAIVIAIVIIALLAGDNRGDITGKPPSPLEFKPEGRLALLANSGDTLGLLDIEIARDIHDQQVGLMFRDRLEDNQGMLFVYQYARFQAFWMKNESIPLDILFLDEGKKVINIAAYTIPNSEEKYLSLRPAQYVLEVRAGLCDDLGIDSTCAIDWIEF